MDLIEEIMKYNSVDKLIEEAIYDAIEVLIKISEGDDTHSDKVVKEKVALLKLFKISIPNDVKEKLKIAKQNGKYKRINFNSIKGYGLKDLFKKGVSLVKEGISRVRQFIYGKDNLLPLPFRNAVEKNADKKIESMQICRVPLAGAFNVLGNLVSRGEYEKKVKSLDYDAMFHLYLKLKLNDGSNWILEKNEVPELKPAKNDSNIEGHVCVPVETKGEISLPDLIENTIKHMGIRNYTHYDFIKLNCQNFVWNTLIANRLIKPSYTNFIMQNVEQVANSIPSWSRKLINFATNLADRGNVLIHGGFYGGAVQSVIFRKTAYTKAAAKRWIRAHGYKHVGIDEKPQFYRIRQENPKKYTHYSTKIIDPNIMLILGYK
ncbi:MAG TPA: hypothetical protein PKJ74_07185 [Chitinophagales bacterium]|nr:hypothetical protein [Chitinophagales bacterium]